MKLFVYGTLRQGWGNARLYEGIPYQRYDAYLPGHKLVATPHMAFPFCIADATEQDPVAGELLIFPNEREEEVLETLDRLEGHPNFYTREERPILYYTGAKKELQIEDRAWVYLIQGRSLQLTRECTKVINNDWNTRRFNRLARAG